MYEDIIWLRRQEKTIRNLKAERDTYEQLTWMAVVGMAIMTVGFVMAISV